MSLSRFESRFVQLREDDPTGSTAPAILQRAMAMLADLAADTPEEDAERARAMLTQAALRMETAFRDWPDITEPLAGWRRDVTLCPADDGRALRCHAIRAAERLLRSAVETAAEEGLGDDAYRSSSMSQ